MRSDNEDAVAKLEALRERISDLKKMPRLSTEFVEWHDQTIKLITETFGRNSEELREFQELQFEQDPEALDSFKRGISDLSKAADAEPSSGSPLSDKFEILADPAQQRYYEKQLETAGELLTTMIYSQRRE